MLYNILFTRSTDAFFKTKILGLSDIDLEKFIEIYEIGGKEFFFGGDTYDLRNLDSVRVYDCCRASNANRNDLLNASDSFRSENGGLADWESFLSKLGTNITHERMRIGYGKKMQIEANITNNVGLYVNESRIIQIAASTKQNYDTTKLARLCEELNSSFQRKNYYSVGMLVRAIIDHVPPVFNCKNFNEVENNYNSQGNSKSFKSSMKNLNQSMRNISDKYLHSQISKKELLPNETQVDCKRDLDVLLEEILRILS